LGLGVIGRAAAAVFVPAMPAAAAATARVTIASSATPTAVGQDLTINTLKVTNVLASSNGVLLGALGVLVLIGGALAGLITYRRRIGRPAPENDDLGERTVG
jgi:hypothetical protein